MKGKNDKTMAAIKKAINQAQAVFKKSGLLETFTGDLFGHGKAPKSAREAAARRKKALLSFAEERDRVIAWHRDRGRLKGINRFIVSPSFMFAKATYVADVNKVDGCYMNDEAEPGVIVPICKAGGRGAPRQWRDSYHWHAIRFDSGWDADSWGVMCHTSRLYDAIVFLYVTSVVADEDDFNGTYVNADLIP